MAIVDDAGDIYQLFATPDCDDLNSITIGAALIRRGTKKHTFYRERRNFDYRRKVNLGGLASALDEALGFVSVWISQAGHTRTPA